MKNIKVSVKFIGGFLAVALIALATGILMLTSLYDVDEKYSKLNETATEPMAKMIDQVRSINQIRIYAREVVLARSMDELRNVEKTVDEILNDVKKMVEWQNGRLIHKENKAILDNLLVNMGNYRNEISMMAKEVSERMGNEAAKVEVYYAHKANLDKELAEILKANKEFADIKLKNNQKGQEENSAYASRALTICEILLAITFLASIFIGIYMTSVVNSPLKKVLTAIGKGESGDMTARTGIYQKDELGSMASSLDKFFSNLQGILKSLRINSDTLAGASEQLSAVSRQLASGAEETVAQSNTVASTTEQMAVNINAMASGAEEASANANEVAGAAEEMSVNMSTIASAIEEMSASIGQIASNAGDARKVASDASQKSEDATNVMNRLGSAAKEIGEVTDVIKKIADKTNLLALNATIEAASAGDAGKGFAVVAGEIKELANQSAKSADDIAHRIESIQSGTNDAVRVIHDVNDIILRINQSVEAIAGHVEQQTKASNEIANNVEQANTGAKRVASAISEVAKGANDVSRNASEAARGASDVSQNIINVSYVAKESAQGAEQVSQSATDLSKIASELQNTVSRFKV